MQLSLPNDPDDPARHDPAPDARDTPAERRALIALSLVPGIGPGRLRALLARFHQPTRVMRAPRSALQQVRGIGPQTADAIRTFDDHAAVDAQWARAEELGATFIPLWDARFPDRLQQIYDPPAYLWMRGTLTEADARCLAIVGTRRCSDYGRAQAHHFAQALVQQGFTIVSGLAYGIDAAAHNGALDAGGRTLAVLGSGVGRIYPQKHTRLAADIAARGAVLSEYGLDAAPDAANFPERNRIVSGLTLGTLVVESHAEGGALITARMAVEQNREVFAVPGNAGKRTSRGTNRLIQRGHAKLVLDVDDILEELPVSAAPPDTDEAAPADDTPDPADALTGEAKTLYDALSDTPVHIDTLCAETGLSPSTALVRLLELEFKGLVRQLAGKQFRRA
jgi:DNA processing protein